MSGFYVCESCHLGGTDFRVPVDKVGAVLMAAHLLDKHGISTPGITAPKVPTALIFERPTGGPEWSAEDIHAALDEIVAAEGGSDDRA